MNKKKSIVISIVVIVAMIAFGLLLKFGLSAAGMPLSVLGGGGATAEWPEITCETDQGCYDSFIAKGFPKAELDEQLKTITLTCGNQGFCIAQEKR